jgi:hypothetical protein
MNSARAIGVRALLTLIILHWLVPSVFTQSVYHYRIALTSEQKISFSTLAKVIQTESQSEGATAAQDLAVRLQVSGTLTVSVLKNTPNACLLAYTLAPSSLTLITNGATASESEMRALRRELQQATFYAEMDAQGAIRKVWLHRAREVSQGMLRTLAALMQASLPPKDAASWEATEESPEGVYLARYTLLEQKASFWRMQKQWVRYTETQPTPFATAYEIRPQGSLQIDYDTAQRAVRRVKGSLQLTSLVKDQTIGTATVAFEAQRFRVAQLPDAERKRLLQNHRQIARQAQSLRITAVEVSENAAIQVTRAELGNETYASLKQRWSQLSDDANITEIAELSRKWRALLILTPQIVASTEHTLRTLAFNSVKAQVLISALMQSGTTETQQALCRLADHFLKRADNEAYNHYVACLALLESPHLAVLQWLVAKAQSASPDTAYPALLALGAVGRITPPTHQPQARDTAYKTILDKLNTAQSDKDIEVCLLALGNLGHPDSLPVLEPFLSHENETLRAVATSSLRFIETPAAERLLMRMLRDASREVRLQAIEAFNHRRISQALLPELAQYLREESQKDLRRALIDALWLHRSRVSGVRPLIAQAATGDPDEEIRLYAQGLLQQKE